MSTLSPKEEEKLATEIAQALHEPENIALYLKFVQTVPQDYLLKKLAYVLSKSDSEIQNKAAYFNSIVSTYGQPKKFYRRR